MPQRLTIDLLIVVALIAAILMISLALLGQVRAATECEPQRVIGDKHYWSWRIIDGRQCWYRGRPGKPKHELGWVPTRSPSAGAQPVGEANHGAPLRSDSAAPTLTEDLLLEHICCWPDLEELQRETEVR